VHPTLTRSEFLESILLDFNVSDIPASKARRLRVLQQLLQIMTAQGWLPVLVVDEVRKLSAELLEEVRLLLNLTGNDGRLLQIVLAAQPELDQILERPDLRQFR
jgi:type II secretory pathway predicted ATPase ExeA